MKIKALLATLVGAVAINGATAGEWCAPAPDKCPVECCPDSAGSISIGYDTDYIFYGVRLARDNIWADVNYTFDQLPVPVTIGVWHLTSLSSTPNGLGAGNGGDETDLYASIALPSVMGLDLNLGYTHYMFSNLRAPGGPVGDSTGEVSLGVSTEIMDGISLGYRVAYDFNQASATAPAAGARSTQDGAWIHTLSVGGTFDVTDCIGLALEAGVLYTDNYWTNIAGNTRDSGWNNYYVKAGLAIPISCNATLTPYIGYSGSPDTWVADGTNGIGSANLNANDVFHWGVSLGVDF